MFTGPLIATPPAPMIRWKRTVAGSTLAIDIDRLKTFLNIPVEDTFFDAEKEGFIRVAQAEIERHCRLVMTASTWVGTLPMLYDQVRLVLRPFLDVTGVQYVEAGTGEIKTLDPTLYHVLPVDQNCGMLFVGEGVTLPDMANRHDAVRITARAGFGISDDELAAGYEPLPDIVEHALLMTTAALDMARGDTQASPGANVTVYAMKQSKGGSIIPVEARTILGEWTYRWITV